MLDWSNLCDDGDAAEGHSFHDAHPIPCRSRRHVDKPLVRTGTLTRKSIQTYSLLRKHSRGTSERPLRPNRRRTVAGGAEAEVGVAHLIFHRPQRRIQDDAGVVDSEARRVGMVFEERLRLHVRRRHVVEGQGPASRCGGRFPVPACWGGVETAPALDFILSHCHWSLMCFQKRRDAMPRLQTGKPGCWDGVETAPA